METEPLTQPAPQVPEARGGSTAASALVVAAGAVLALALAFVDEPLPIKEAMSKGTADGIVTNSSLAAKGDRDFKELIIDICHLVDGPISAEAVSLEADAIINEGRGLARLHTNVIVKFPLIPEGPKATG
jgi:transaldolase